MPYTRGLLQCQARLWVAALHGKAVALQWNVVECGQCLRHTVPDAQHLYVRLRKLLTELGPSCLLLHLGYGSLSRSQHKWEKITLFWKFFYKWPFGYI